jgi:hypothetical protein
MAKTIPYYGTPRLEGQHPDVFPGSPLALIAIYVEAIRLRFSQDNKYKLPYYWEQDPTPTSDEEHTDDAPRKILIESQYAQHPDARDYRPAIFVDRGDMAFSKIVVGNRAAHDIPTQEDLYLIHVTTPLSVLCISKDRGESMSIGEIVAFYLTTLMTQMREAFGLQDVTPPVLGTTQVYRRNSNEIEEWITPITFQITCKHLWTEIPIAPKLREIALSLSTNASNGSPTIEQYTIYGRRRR